MILRNILWVRYVSEFRFLPNHVTLFAHFVSRESQCFPEAQPRETLRFEGNKMNCFLRDQS